MQVRRTTTVAMLATILTLSGGLAATALEPGAWPEELEPGVCFDDVFDANGDFDFSVAPPVVSCHEVHGDEVVAVVPYTEDAYPGEEALSSMSVESCAPEYEAFLGRPIAETAAYDFTVWPSEADWEAGMRAAYCIVYFSEPVAGTAASGTLRAPGHTIAALGEVDGTRDIFLVDGADGDIRKLAGDDLAELLGAAAWTPDGSAIAFAAETEDGDALIHVVDRDGGRSEVLVDGPGINDGPSFSPDGTALAYMSTVDDPEFELYSLDLADGDMTRLTEHPDRDTTVRWSPDGTRLAFRRRTDGVSSIWVMDADGSGAVQLTDDAADDYDPSWSPDGRQLLFTSLRAGDYDVWVMDADGGAQRPLTTHPADDEHPDWSPDGEYIAFHSARHGGKTLWLMRADGSEQSELSGQAPLGYPGFAPTEMD
jgi:hypothetical protein